MDVLTPRSLDEALALKAEHPDGVPIEGGTDVMVDLNFDRARPPAILNLNEVRELKGWSRENGALRLGAGLTYAEAMQAPREEFLYVACLHAGTGIQEPDFLAVVDVNPASDTYSRILHQTPMPHVGD